MQFSHSHTSRTLRTSTNNPNINNNNDENWENTFLEELTAAEGEAEDASQEMDEEDDEYDDGPVVPKLKTYKEAINSLEDVCQFLEHKGHAWN